MALIPTAFFFGDTPPSPGVIVGKFVPLPFPTPTPAPDYRPFFLFLKKKKREKYLFYSGIWLGLPGLDIWMYEVQEK